MRRSSNAHSMGCFAKNFYVSHMKNAKIWHFSSGFVSLHGSEMEVSMDIRRGEERDLAGINKLLCQVLTVHHNGRPDLFKANAKKYTDDELVEILYDDTKPVFVASDEDNNILGYAFCVFQQHLGDNILTDIKTLYIDDLCVDEISRGQHIGRQLYEYVLDFAKREGCYNVTLNVWECNPGAKIFYQKCGLMPQKIGMEKIL